MSLASNAILSLNDYKEIVGVSRINAKVDDTQLEWHINAASQAIENHCHRGFVSPAAAVTETFTGNDTSYYHVRHRHIASSTAPALYYWSNNSWQTVDATSWPWSYDANNEKGRVFYTDGNIFFAPNDGEYENWKLTYVYGWAIANVPQDVKMACAELVFRSIERTTKSHMTSESFGESSTSYNLDKLITDTLAMELAKYCRIII